MTIASTTIIGMGEPPAVPPQKPFVFLCDLDAARVGRMRMGLEQAGYSVEVLAFDLKGLDRVVASKFAWVALFVGMKPEMTEIFCAKIRNQDTLGLASILVLTGEESVAEVKKFYEIGVDVCLPMEADFEVVLGQIGSLIRRVNFSRKLHVEAEKSRNSHHSRYRLQKQIGEGGLGRVYRAWDSALARDVAIKSFKITRDVQNVDEDQVWREARITAKLNHPNIVSVYDCWMGVEDCFVVMELLNGISLEAFAAKKGVTVQLFEVIARQTLHGLATAHKAGILHCDLKPSNIMLVGDPQYDPGNVQVKILDFGTAKLVKEITPDFGASGVVEGSPLYIAPEVVTGQRLDERSDLYSLGHILYYALTGKTAVTGESLDEVLDSHFAGEFAPLANMRIDLSHPICDWVHAHMNRDPMQRPANGEESLNLLHALFFEQRNALSVV